MKRGLLAAAIALTTAVGFAQADTVIFTKVLDVEKTVGASANSGTYVPGADKFLIGDPGSVNVFNGLTGAAESDLNISGITPSSNGFFALTATEDGYIYGYENGGDDIWRWSSVSDIPVKVADTVPGSIERLGATATVEGQITIATTGAVDDGNVNFFSDSFPFATGSFSFNEAVDLNGKSGLALSSDGTTLFTVGSTGGSRSISKWNKVDGLWTVDPVWPAAIIPPTGEQAAYPNFSGPMAYDAANDILFVLNMRANTGETVLNKIFALDGSTAETIGEVVPENASGTLGGYAGAYVSSTGPTGILSIAARAGSANTNAVLYKYSYVIDTSGVEDWSLYQQ